MTDNRTGEDGFEIGRLPMAAYLAVVVIAVVFFAAKEPPTLVGVVRTGLLSTGFMVVMATATTLAEKIRIEVLEL